MRWRALLLLGLVGGAVSAGLLAAPSSGEPARRGGTIRLDLTSDFDFIDPALVGDTSAWSLSYATQCKLMNFPDREGAAGLRATPEVAAGPPKVSNGGRTYTFTLRKNYRFSTGARVTARNFARAFERDATKAIGSPAMVYMHDIVGAEAKYNGQARTISGVRVLGPYKLRITLEAPSGGFPARLTMPFFSAVPTGAPARPVDKPLASCGPYYVRSWDKNKAAILARNRFYTGPRPRNPDRVEIRRVQASELIFRLENGASDVAVGLPPSAYPDLARKYGVNTGRFFVKPSNTFWYLAFNHDRPLFGENPKLRRAVNFALDRRTLVPGAFGPGGAEPMNQILPPDFPGYRDWNLFPLQDPNFPQARTEAAGNTRSGTVRLWTFQGAGSNFAQGIRGCLFQIGLNTQIRSFPSLTEMYNASQQPNAEFDLLLNGWGEDYADPYDFIDILLNGTSQGRPNGNVGHFDEPVWRDRIEAGVKVPWRARYGPSTLDRDLMRDAAPIVPLANPNARTLVSPRVRNYIFHKIYGTDFAAINLVG